MNQKPKAPERAAEPRHGSAPGGESINPMALPEPPDSADSEEEPTVAPYPGVPMSDQEYERLKEDAKHGSTPGAHHAQEDRPPAKK